METGEAVRKIKDGPGCLMTPQIHIPIKVVAYFVWKVLDEEKEEEESRGEEKGGSGGGGGGGGNGKKPKEETQMDKHWY